MAKSFDQLASKMSPKAIKKAEEKTEKMLAEITLSELRKSRKVTQKELASILNVEQASISKLENRAGISIASLNKIINALGGQLEITAKFPDEEIKITKFYEVQHVHKFAN